MGMTSFIRGAFTVLGIIIVLYILETTFPMDALYLQFYNMIPKLYMNPTWDGIALKVLGGWVWYGRSFVIIIIAIVIWLASLIFVDVDYTKQRPGQYK